MVCIRERKMYFKIFVLKGLNQRIQVQLWVNNWSNNKLTYFLQIIFSQLYFWAKRRKLGSMTPPRRRSTRWSVDSKNSENHGNVILYIFETGFSGVSFIQHLVFGKNINDKNQNQWWQNLLFGLNPIKYRPTHTTYGNRKKFTNQWSEGVVGYQDCWILNISHSEV